MELKQYAAVLWRWAWLIITCAAVAAVLAFVVTRAQPPVYAASTTLLVNAPNGQSNQFSDSSLRSTEGMIGTYAELLVKRPVLLATIKSLNLDMSPEELARQVKVVSTAGTLLLVITVEAGDPNQAAAVANELVRTLNQQEKDLLSNPYAGYREALQVIEVAEPRFTPIRPNIPYTVMMALLAGLTLGVAAALLIEYSNNTARSIDDVQRILGLPTLASVARIAGQNPAERLVTLREPRSPMAEVYRMFLAHIEFATIKHPIRSLLVTSAEPGEGKSTTIANLAIALAQSGREVILVDLDLRLPSLHKLFGLSNNVGVTTALLQQGWDKLDEYLQPSGIEGLRVMGSGVLPTNPARLISSARLPELVEQLSNKADIVLIDSPSTLAVVDASLIARATDATVFVVGSDSTRAPELKRTKELLSASGTYMLGVVLNRANAEGIFYYDGESSSGLGAIRRRVRRLLRRNVRKPVSASGKVE